MKVARTASELLAQLDDELSWRVVEIAAIQKAIVGAKGSGQTALIRAGLPLLYAHWEGCVKLIAIRYVEFISKQDLKYSELKHCFSGLKALGQVKQMHSITKRVFAASDLLSQIYHIESEKAIIPLKSYVSNVGNLNFDLFEQVANFIDIDPSRYSSRKHMIDDSLLKQRNEIAHGEYLVVDHVAFDSLAKEVLTLLRQFKDDVQNALVQRSYLRSSVLP